MKLLQVLLITWTATQIKCIHVLAVGGVTDCTTTSMWIFTLWINYMVLNKNCHYLHVIHMPYMIIAQHIC